MTGPQTASRKAKEEKGSHIHTAHGLLCGALSGVIMEWVHHVASGWGLSFHELPWESFMVSPLGAQWTPVHQGILPA